MSFHNFFLFAHLAGVIVWVGGMVFAHFFLRPAALGLEPPLRLQLWKAVLRRFFTSVWTAIGLILGSGFAMLLETGFAQAAPSAHLMMFNGFLMTAIFASIWFGPWAALQRAVHAQAWADGAVAMNRIRLRVTVNLFLGTLTVVIATVGRTL
ncbi:CopD family protein [Zoogloea sp.]|uniref:CopD family protein n=1 Tax=Zoogloea sp. TaxID=49181 RepID=UPI0026116A54|nr:CopD family protein [Zoogloea sp.]MDD3353652.1 hypothetical protein [Zoogloea sp.]